MEMNELWQTLISYPTGVYTTLIGVLLIFWLFAILGALDIDIISFDSDIDVDIDADIEIPGFIGLMHTLGLTGVPFTIVITVLVFLAWVMTYFVSVTVLPYVPSLFLNVLVGTVTVIGTFVLAVPVTAKIVSPLRKLAETNRAKSNKDFLGGQCKVTSLTVDDTFGQGKIKTKGTSLVVRIRADVPNKIKKGDIVRPIHYDEAGNFYHVLTNEQFEENLKEQ